MPRAVVNFFLLLAFVGVVVLHAFAQRDPTRRNVEFLPDMAYSPAYDSYQPNPNFSDGTTLQMPEPGTISRDRLPLHYGPSFPDFMRAGNELVNPFGLPAVGTSTVGLLASPLGQGPLLAAAALTPGENNSFAAADPRIQERGAFVFKNYCQMCHGPQGKGDGSMARRGIPLGPTASLLAEKAVPPKPPLKDGEMFHIITYGQKNMPSHAALLTREDRWKVILYVRSLQQAAGDNKP